VGAVAPVVNGQTMTESVIRIAVENETNIENLLEKISTAVTNITKDDEKFNKLKLENYVILSGGKTLLGGFKSQFTTRFPELTVVGYPDPAQWQKHLLISNKDNDPKIHNSVKKLCAHRNLELTNATYDVVIAGAKFSMTCEFEKRCTTVINAIVKEDKHKEESYFYTYVCVGNYWYVKNPVGVYYGLKTDMNPKIAKRNTIKKDNFKKTIFKKVIYLNDRVDEVKLSIKIPSLPIDFEITDDWYVNNSPKLNVKCVVELPKDQQIDTIQLSVLDLKGK